MDIEKLFQDKLRNFAIQAADGEGVLSIGIKEMMIPSKDSLNWQPPTNEEILEILYTIRSQSQDNLEMANKMWGERLVYDILVALEHRPGKYQNAFADRRYPLAAYHGHTLLYLATGLNWDSDNHHTVPSFVAECTYSHYEALQMTKRLEGYVGSHSWNSMRELEQKTHPWAMPEIQPRPERRDMGVMSIPLWGIERYLNRGTEVAINLGIL